MERERIELELSDELARVSFLLDQLTLARLGRLADKKWQMLTRGRLSTLLREICQLVAAAEPGAHSLVLVPREEKPQFNSYPSLDL